jgi:hypothetical protein
VYVHAVPREGVEHVPPRGPAMMRAPPDLDLVSSVRCALNCTPCSAASGNASIYVARTEFGAPGPADGTCCAEGEGEGGEVPRWDAAPGGSVVHDDADHLRLVHAAACVYAPCVCHLRWRHSIIQEYASKSAAECVCVSACSSMYLCACMHVYVCAHALYHPSFVFVLEGQNHTECELSCTSHAFVSVCVYAYINVSKYT